MTDMIGRILLLEKAVKLFTATADDSGEMPKVQRGQKEWRHYMFGADQWKWLALIHDVLEVYHDLIITLLSLSNSRTRFLLKYSSNSLQILMFLYGRLFHSLNIFATNGRHLWIIPKTLSFALQFLLESHLSTSTTIRQ